MADIEQSPQIGCPDGIEAFQVVVGETIFVELADKTSKARSDTGTPFLDELGRIVEWQKQRDPANSRRLALAGALIGCDNCKGDPVNYDGSLEGCRLKPIMEALRASTDTYDTGELDDEEDTPWRFEALTMYPDILEEPNEEEEKLHGFYFSLAEEFVRANHNTWDPPTGGTTDVNRLALPDDLKAGRESAILTISVIVAERAFEMDESTGTEEQMRLLIDIVQGQREKAKKLGEEKARYAERKAAMRAIDDDNTIARAASIVALRAAEAQSDSELA